MDDGFWVLLIIALVLYLLIGPGLGIIAFSRVKGVSTIDVDALRKRIDALGAEVAALRGLGPQPQAAAAAPAAPASTPASPASAGGGLERWLTSRGLIWLGGVILALAGLFLAKYTYDHGWLALGPTGRVASGF